MRTVFLIDDDRERLALLSAQIERGRRYVTKGFTTATHALEAIESEPPDLVLCAGTMHGGHGVQLTLRLRSERPSMPVILVTPRGREADAEPAMESGVSDFITYPVEPIGLLMRIRRALQEAPAHELLETATRKAFDPHGIIGDHPRVHAVRDFVDGLASDPQVPVLLLGETGTGKNLVARAIHVASGLPGYRFFEVNCAALTADRLEAELFGYDKNALAGAPHSKKGLFELAHGGTLFLDEIRALPFRLQTKLMTFLESGLFRRIGAASEIDAQIRVVAATSVDLASEVAADRFRHDLFNRLEAASITLPPLRMIRSDIPSLSSHFVARAAEYFRRPVPRIDEGSLDRLTRHDWPGNARELRNTLERALIFSRGPVLRLPVAFANPSTLDSSFEGADRDPTLERITIPKGLTLDAVESLYIQATLEDMNGCVSDAASSLGVSRKVLWSRRKRHGLMRNGD